MSEKAENIKVFVRVRPSICTDAHRIVNVTSDQEIALLANGSAETKYKFSKIFGEQMQPDDVYNGILVPIVSDFIQGYNCTLFTYGTTRTDASNANTSYMNATSSSTSFAQPVAAGAAAAKLPTPTEESVMNSLAACAMYRLFEHLTQMDLSSSVRISYLEIRDEELVDLLHTNGTASPPAQLKIFENDNSQVYVNGLTEMTVHSAAEAMMIFRLAQKNVPSFKSHTIFTISVQTKEKPKFQMHENEGLFKRRRLCLVQLGSQESQKKQARAKTVQSLTSLSRVVQALIYKQTYIPYRDSKLTRIMQESLGGNAKTSILATIGASINCIDDTIQALDLLNRMKCICNHPKVNERLDDARTLNEMALEIRKLMMDIEANRNKTGHFLTDDMYTNYQSEMQVTKAISQQHKHEFMRVNEEVRDLDGHYSNKNANLCAKNDELAVIQSIASTKQKHLQNVSKVTEFRTTEIERRVAKEETITDQANQVTTAIREVLTDKTNLDDCVERYKSTDDRFIKTVHDFQTDLQQKLDKLGKFSNDTRITIDAKLRKTGELERNFLRGASALIELIKMRSFGLLEKLEESVRNETDTWNGIKSGFHDILLSHVKSAETNIEIYNEYANKLEEQSMQIDKSYRELREMYQIHFNVVNMMIDDIQKRLKCHGEKVPELTSAMRLMVENCAKIGGNIDDKMQTIYEQMRAIVHQVQQNSDEIKQSVEPALLASEINVQQTVEAITETLDAHQTAINEELFIFTKPQLPDNFMVMQSQLKNTITHKLTLLNNLMENVSGNNNAAIDCGVKHIDGIAMNIPMARDIIKGNAEVEILRSQLNENRRRVSQEYEDSAVIVNDITTNAEQVYTNLNQQIASCRNQLKYFREMDFCEYEPSGETPAKRDYPGEIRLAATTPLEKMKQRFRDRISQISNASPTNANYSFLGN